MTPSERAMVARIAAFSRWATEDPVEATKAARAASPAQLPYWERKVDPDGTLAPAERMRRAEAAKKAHFQRLALASAKARKRAS